MVASHLEREGLSPVEARQRCWFMNSRGLVVRERADLAAHLRPFAHEHPPIQDLLAAVNTLRPTVLIGACGQPRLFTAPVLAAMARWNERPIVFALSNPTSKSECTAEEEPMTISRPSTRDEAGAGEFVQDPREVLGREIEARGDERPSRWAASRCRRPPPAGGAAVLAQQVSDDALGPRLQRIRPRRRQRDRGAAATVRPASSGRTRVALELGEHDLLRHVDDGASRRVPAPSRCTACP